MGVKNTAVREYVWVQRIRDDGSIHRVHHAAKAVQQGGGDHDRHGKIGAGANPGSGREQVRRAGKGWVKLTQGSP